VLGIVLGSVFAVLFVAAIVVAETVELAGGVNLDVDAEGRVLGVEFLSFDGYMAEHGGELEIPGRVEAPATP